jgi:recombination associated protein RdgC
MFKNAIAYLVTPGFRFDPELLSRRPARPCGSFETRTDGFIEPCEGSTDGLVHSVSGHQVICWETEDKLLPGSVVAETLAERIEKIEDEHGRKVGRKEARDLKERIIEELLPKAFVQHRRTHGILAGRYFIINTSSAARTDDFLSALRSALDSRLPLQTIQTNVSPVSAMTGWVAENDAPQMFSIDSTLELRSASETSAAIRYVNHDLGGSEVAGHVANGKLATRLGMTFNDRMSFVLDDKLHIKRIAYLDIIQEQVEMEANSSTVFDADITIGTAEVVGALDWLIDAMGGFMKPEADLLEAA